MRYHDYHKRLMYLLKLLKNGRLRSPKELAGRWHCSEKTIRNMINQLGEKGYVVWYSKSCKRYILENDQTEK